MNKIKFSARSITISIVLILSIGCSSNPPAPTSAAFTQTPRSIVPTTTAIPTSTSTPTITPTPTPVPNPLQIDVMRQQEYPGSDITIEQELPNGSNYKQYIASYLSEGLKIYALLTVPLGQKPDTGWPVIVFNHGFIPPQTYRTTERYVAYVAGFARSGYIVIKPDYRGHGSSEGEATGGYGSPDYTIDVLNALASIKKYPDADPNRIGMWGHSMGGSLTLRAMVISQDIKAGVIWGGVVASYADLLSKWHRPRPGETPTPASETSSQGRRWRNNLITEYGSPEENPDFWNSISPIDYVSDVSGPIQLDHSTTDEEVPYAFSVSLNQALLAAGKTVEFYSYEGDNHNIANNFGLAMSRSIKFFDKYVKNIGPLG
ncbi:MAG TPA: alpha/beta fold hydrolase [Anaerolineae bacterium]|nr:alpha/beta fold hydrolase [Anaerolineae bacterium]